MFFSPKKRKIAIFGDIHGNLEAFENVVKVMKAMGATDYVCLGDIVGYNANPRECVALLHSLKPLAVIRGNHDDYCGSEKDLTPFNQEAASALRWTREHLEAHERLWLANLPYEQEIRCRGYQPFQVVHGTLNNPYRWSYVFNKADAEDSLNCQEDRVCFCGHTHVPMFYAQDTSSGEVFTYLLPEDRPVEIKPNMKFLFNIGSVGQPRDGNWRASFVFYSLDGNTVQLYRIPYDIDLCQQKILDAGLPEHLATRLAQGH